MLEIFYSNHQNYLYITIIKTQMTQNKIMDELIYPVPIIHQTTKKYNDNLPKSSFEQELYVAFFNRRGKQQYAAPQPQNKKAVEQEKDLAKKIYQELGIGTKLDLAA